MSRKNPRLVKVKTIIPSEYVKEILRFQALSSKSLRDNVNSVGEMVNTLHEVHDSDVNLIFNKIDALRNYVEKSFILNFVVLSLVTLILLLS